MGPQWHHRLRASCLIGCVAVFALGTGVLATGCGRSTTPCVVIFNDAVVHVRAAMDSETLASIDSIFVTKVVVDGRPRDLYWGFWNPRQSGVELIGDTLHCAVPCAFGTDSGRWELTVFARGYPEQTVTFDARFNSSGGKGCRLIYDNGTTLSIGLRRNPL